MKHVADDFTQYLRESGYEVLVSEPYSIERDVRPELTHAIEQAVLVVQVLGPEPFPKSTFLKGTRVEKWIADKTKELKGPDAWLSWRPLKPDLELIAEKDFKKFLQGVAALGPEEFKTTVLQERLTKLATEQRSGSRTLFVHYHSDDVEPTKSVADEVATVAEQKLAEHLDVLRFDEKRDPQRAIGMDPVHGLLVVYGQCDEDWVEQHAKTLKQICNTANLKHKLGKPVGAIVKTDLDRPDLRRVPGDWDEFTASETHKLERFVATVCGKKVQS